MFIIINIIFISEAISIHKNNILNKSISNIEKSFFQKKKFVIKSAWARASIHNNFYSVIYITIYNDHNVPITLLLNNIFINRNNTNINVAEKIGIYTNTTINNITKIIPINRIIIPAKEKITVKPGGIHMMLSSLKENVKIGDKLYVNFFVKHYGVLKIEVLAFPMNYKEKI